MGEPRPPVYASPADRPARRRLEEKNEMQPVPRRVVKSYNVRFQLEAIMRAGEGPPTLADAIDVHAHAAPGTENPLDMAKRASAANMGGVVFKNLPNDRPYHVTCQEV